MQDAGVLIAEEVLSKFLVLLINLHRMQIRLKSQLDRLEEEEILVSNS